MLKFVPKNETEKKDENLIKEELSIKTSLFDFLSSDPNEIKEKILSSLGDIKLKTRKDEMFYTKLVYYFSLVVEAKNFSFNDKARKAIDNLLSICDLEEEKFICIYEDLYNLFSEEEIDVKKYLLQKIFESKNKNLFSNDEKILKIIYLVINYIKLSKTKKIDEQNEIIDNLSKKINEKKNYYLFKKVREDEIKILFKLLKNNKEVINKSKEESKLFFFLTMSSNDLVDINLEDNLKLNSELKNEIQLIQDMYDRKDDKILYQSENYKLSENYGTKSEEIILMGAKECSIQQIINSFDDDKKNFVTFKELIQQIYEQDDDDKKVTIKDEDVQEKFENIEEVIISGNDKKLFDVFIDYDLKEIKILYVRKQVYEEQQKNNLLDKVKKMKNNLEMILSAIDNI